jgi:RNA polymerase sigma-70 factor (ECF subfamily)
MPETSVHPPSWQTHAGFEALFKAHYAELCAYALRFVHDASQAEEIVQAVFVKFWEKREQIEIKTSAQPYLFRAVRNAALNAKRDAPDLASEESLATMAGSQGTENQLDENELSVQIAEAIQAMPPVRRQVFLLSREEGKKYREIAEELEVSIKTVENHMGKALSFMREKLKEFLFLVFTFLFF